MDNLMDDEGIDEFDMEMEEDMMDLSNVMISMEDAWVVIDSYFEEKGLVGQQVDSFDEFLTNTVQELIDDAGEIIVTPENQFIPGQDLQMVRASHRSPLPQAAIGLRRRLWPSPCCFCSVRRSARSRIDLLPCPWRAARPPPSPS